MAKKKYLKLYEEWSKTGKLPKEGLCKSLSEEEVELFVSTREEYGVFTMSPSDFFWGYSGRHGDVPLGVSRRNVARDFTPLRQNIVLFLAAMNGEI